jgi:shikimate dehydrogenase
MTDRYAVFGNPIAHSKSPDIHRQFAAQTAQQMSYSRQLVAEDQFAQAAAEFFASGGLGLNITVPFKLDAYRFANHLTERAQLAGAVNTLAKQDQIIIGDNTDGHGLINDISSNLHWQIKGKKVLLLGAGGAVRGVLGPLLEQQPAQVLIANRTVEKAQQLAVKFADRGELLACGFEQLQPGQEPFDMVINGTSASLAGELPPLPQTLLAEKACCYDMMYGPQPTVFMDWSKANGAHQVADGLGMLVEQAAESFYLWRGLRPETGPVIASLRSQLLLP